jgi:hypothetical protein
MNTHHLVLLGIMKCIKHFFNSQAGIYYSNRNHNEKMVVDSQLHGDNVQNYLQHMNKASLT